MKLESLIVKSDMIKKTYDFADKTHIFSKENTVGKTTLLRAILYTLGYNIPATKGLKGWKNITLEMTLIAYDNSRKTLLRKRKDEIILFENGNKSVYILPEEQIILHRRIFGIDSDIILSILLGAFYMDQEKGWTLLNRGKTISSNSFHITDFLSGLYPSKAIEDIDIKIRTLGKEKKKYKVLKQILSLEEELVKDSDILHEIELSESINSKLSRIRLEKKIILRQIKELKNAIRDNIKFTKYIENLKLGVRLKENKDEIIFIDKGNLVLPDNNRFLKTKKEILELKLQKITRTEKELQSKIIGQESMAFGEDIIDTYLNNSFKDIPLDPFSVDNLIRTVNNNVSKLKIERNKLYSMNKSIQNIYDNVVKYTTMLGISRFIESGNNFIFTSELKGLSGKVLTQMAFSFKMAYLKELENIFGVKLPIIIDSPGSRELLKKHVDEMLDLLESDFTGYQVIIASVLSDFNTYELLEIEKSFLEG